MVVLALSLLSGLFLSLHLVGAELLRKVTSVQKPCLEAMVLKAKKLVPSSVVKMEQTHLSPGEALPWQARPHRFQPPP